MQGFHVRALIGKLSSPVCCPWAVLCSARGRASFEGDVFPRDELFIARKSPASAPLAPNYP